MACKVIPIDSEFWATVFDEVGLVIKVSSRGRVKFKVNDSAVLTTEQMMDLTITLSRAFEDERVKL